MRLAAVVCEYNPFHNGHKYQLNFIKRDFDAVLCVMSGSFTQRGEAAIYDKWSRAKAAVLNGADLVLELGVRYSLSSAQGFAEGAVDTVLNTGVCDAIVFGSEANDISRLSTASDILLSETPVVSKKIKSLLDDGLSYPMARQKAFSGKIDEDILDSPNNILALEYLMALKRRKSGIEPITHARTVSYSASSELNGYASASHIRKKIIKGEDFSSLTPFEFSECEIYDTNRLTDIFKFLLLTKKEALFDGIPDAEPGLYNRFLKAIDEKSFDEIIKSASTKRYTNARLRRISLRAILGIKGGYCPPEYIRVLAATEKGRKILSEMKTKSAVPVITKTADFPKEMLAEDILATDIASLCADMPKKKGRDFLISPIMV